MHVWNEGRESACTQPRNLTQILSLRINLGEEASGDLEASVCPHLISDVVGTTGPQRAAVL